MSKGPTHTHHVTPKDTELLKVQTPGTTKLNAKLHQGYEANTEQKVRGALLGGVQYEKPRMGEENVVRETITRHTQENTTQSTGGLASSSTNSLSELSPQSGVLTRYPEAELPGHPGSSGQTALSSSVFVLQETSVNQLPPVTDPGSSNSNDNTPLFGSALVASSIAPGTEGGTAPSGSSAPAPANSNNPTPGSPQPPSAPVISISQVSGQENQPTALNIGFNADSTATTVIIIGNIPTGATLSAGTNNGDGTWTLTPNQLSGLTLTLPAYASGNYALSITATSTENGLSASTTSSLPVAIAGEATTPTLSVQGASGAEDTAIPLIINAALVDTDGSESLSVTIGNVPTGASLSAGTNNGNGTWTLTPAQLSGLTFTPPAHASGNYSLTVTATSQENGTSATTSASLAVSVAGTATTPSLSVQTSSGAEDTAIPLSINAALIDTDGSETLSITIGNVPSGAILSAGTNNGNGTWTLTPAQLSGLTFTPPAHASGSYTLSVIATSSENGLTASATSSLGVTVTGAATTPSLTVQTATGNEDTAIPLQINAALVDTDGSESLSITISNVPSGATLSAGTNNGNGTWTLTPAQLTGLTFTPPTHASGSYSLSIAATSSENGSTATASSSLAVNVTGVATTPTLSVQAASGNEDTAIPLAINAALVDTDGSETLSVTIGNVPTGASFSAGTNNGNGSWTFTPTQLTGLTFTPPAHASGNYTLSVTAISQENSSTASTSTSLAVSVAGAATTPSLTVQASSGNEDTAIPLAINAALVDTDGSETLSVTIGNVPSGASLSAGTNNGNGTWTLTPAQLTNLTFTPPLHASGNYSLSVTATSQENGSTASTSSSLAVNVAGVATAPTLSVQAASGNEDTAIPLQINAALVDTDGSESLSILISNVPTGATLSAGVNNGNHSWTLTPAQLTNLTFTPPSHTSGDLVLTVTAVSSENGSTANTATPLAVHIAGNATPPLLSVQAAIGSEDTDVPLSINASLVANLPGEVLAITIAVPTGATLSAGTDNGDGTWTLTPAQLTNLTLTPPLHASGNFSLIISAASMLNGSTAVTATTLPLSIAGVATTPSLSVQAASGAEDTAIALPINAALVDTDGSETLSITIGNMPTGASLSAGTNNGNGTWTLTAAQLSGLTFTPPAHAAGSYTLSVTATSSENGTTATATSSLGVTVTGAATTPSLSVQTSSGTEDTAIPLAINAALVDTDGSETLSITIANVPTGATLSAGTNNGNGTWTLTPSQLTGLTFTPPTHASGTYSLSITATSSENGTTATASSTLAVNVAGVATTPTLSVQAANGTEDTAIPLSISSALVDTDGSETLSITIGNVPTGATLSAGTNNGNGTWTLTPSQLTGLTFTPPTHASGNYSLSVTSTSSENGTTATASASLAVSVAGTATIPSLSVQAASGNEDTAIALHINAALVDTDGSEVLSITIGNVPSGASLSAGTNNGNGTWTLTPAELTGLTFTPPAHASGNYSLSVTAVSNENTTTATASASLAVSVAGVATAPNLSAQAASGTEDTAIPLAINAALVDTDGSESLSITIANVPTGATLSAGTNNGNGTWTLTPAQLSGLTFTPPAHASGSYTLAITATSSENGTTATTTSSLAVSVAGAATTPSLTVQAASGAEDTAVPLAITTALVDTDGSETLSITIAGVPTGATLSAGTNNGNGTWTLTPAQLTGLTFTPPTHASGNYSLSITATSSENGTTASASASLGVTVAGAATTPTLSIQSASGLEDTSTALHINAALADTDGSETLAITIAGVPTGATLSAGTNNGNGTWTLTPAQLTNLTLTPAANYSGSFNLSVTATSSENGTTASAATSLPVTIHGVADVPTLSVRGIAGNEDTAIPLAITAALTDTDGSETLLIRVAGMPSGAVLSAGTNNGDGTWTLTPAQLSGLTITPPSHYSGTFNLVIGAASGEEGTIAASEVTIPVHVSGIATTPSLSIKNALGNEDSAIALNIQAALADTDGSETLSVTVAGVPTGATLSAGTNLGGGVWSLTTAQLSNLTITPPLHSDADFTLSITATSQENGTTATRSISLPISVTGLANAPSLTVQNASGAEGTTIALNVSTALVDTDGSENISILISGVPTGAQLSAGLYAGNGNWSLTPAQLSGLTITPAAHYSGTMALTITAVSTEQTGDSADTALPLNVTVSPVVNTPTLSVTAVSGNEDTAIPLNINAALTDTDGSESLTVRIANVPTGATLSAGTNLGGGIWSVTGAQLSGLTITPPANSNASFNLSITATSTETGGATSTTSAATLAVTVNGVADTPTVSASNVTGAAAAQIPLTISGALTDTDGSETITYEVHGIPAGFALSAGINNGDNRWTLTQAQLSGLKIISPEQFNGQLNLQVTSIAHETGGDVKVSSPAAFYVRIGDYANGYLVDLYAGVGLDTNLGGVGTGVHVGAGPDIDLLPATGGILGTNGIYAKEDVRFQIADAPNLLGLPLISGILGTISKIVFSNVPTGTVFTNTAGTAVGNNTSTGVWEFTQAQLNSLYMKAPSNSDNDFTMLVSAKTFLGVTINLVSTPIHVMGVADTPSLSVSAGTGLTEDHTIPVTITGALTDTDGSETLTYEISGMPSGFTLNHGINNGNGTWSLTTSDLSGLTITPAANYSGSASFTVSAIATEREGSQSVVQQTVNVSIAALTDAPTISGTTASGTEDQSIPLNLGISLTDTDGSESLSALTISGLPTGASLTYATDNGNGTWSVQPAHAGDVSFIPPSHWNGDVTLSITATSRESSTGTTASTVSSLALHVEAAATAPVATATDSTGVQDTAIALHVSTALTDTDGSEHLSVTIGGVPDGAMLSSGLNNGNGTWTLTSAQLTNLTLTPPVHYTGDIALTLTAHSMETINGSATSTSANFSVHIGSSGIAPVNTTDWITASDHASSGSPADAGSSDTSLFTGVTVPDAGHGSDYDHLFQ